MEAVIEVALKPMQHIRNARKSSFFKSFTSSECSLTTSADKHYGAVKHACRAGLYFPHEVGIHLPIGGILPGDVVGTNRVSNVQELDFAADIYERSIRVRLQKGVGFFWGQVLHLRIISYLRRK
jgi:hypothetical protein